MVRTSESHERIVVNTLIERLTSIFRSLAIWSFALFVILFLADLCVHWFLITDCVGGSFGYDGCTYRGEDVSGELTAMSMVPMLFFVASGIFLVVFKLLEIGTTQYKQAKQARTR